MRSRWHYIYRFTRATFPAFRALFHPVSGIPIKMDRSIDSFAFINVGVILASNLTFWISMIFFLNKCDWIICFWIDTLFRLIVKSYVRIFSNEWFSKYLDRLYFRFEWKFIISQLLTILFFVTLFAKSLYYNLYIFPAERIVNE